MKAGRRPLSCSEDEIPPEQSDEDGLYAVADTTSRLTSLSKIYTAEEENAIVRKFDKRLVLFMALLYMLSFLDRSSQTHRIVNT